MGDAATRGSVLAAAKPMADASELLVERVMHTHWEESLTPRMRSIRHIWRSSLRHGAPE